MWVMSMGSIGTSPSSSLPPGSTSRTYVTVTICHMMTSPSEPPGIHGAPRDRISLAINDPFFADLACQLAWRLSFIYSYEPSSTR